MVDAVILHTSELCLKGGNRGMFEDRLARNITSRLAGLGHFELVRQQGSFILLPEKPLEPDQLRELAVRLKTVFGLAHFLPARRCVASLPEIEKTASDIMAGRSGTFKVETRRSDKSFQPASPEVSRIVGGAILDAVPGLSVDVHAPETVVRVEIDVDRAFVAAERIEGWGGLPAGSSGKLATLLSGGIDSPVAAWKVMRRGCEVVFVHCHSYPFVGRQSIDKVRRLAALLNDYQGSSTLYLVPFAGIQQAIVDKCGEPWRILLYRRQMLRLAETAARQEGALGLVTGDSIGQVASQTLENMAAVSAVASLPIYRPLVGDNKDDIVRLAREIGTYAVSIEPHDDCCSLFLPPRPATKTDAERLTREEAKYAAADLAAAAWNQAEKVVITAKSWEVGERRS